jgi:hypothetical protein
MTVTRTDQFVQKYERFFLPESSFTFALNKMNQVNSTPLFSKYVKFGNLVPF